MRIKDTTCLRLFEIMDSTARLISKCDEVVQIREMQDALLKRGFKLYFSPIRTELYYGGFVSEKTDEIILCMDYSLKVMKNKERKQREKVLESFTITKTLRMDYDLKDTSEIANEFIKWIVGLVSGAFKIPCPIL
ncbi:hypothetical protein [Helicobacter pylori]|uniref:hypothetical protein n=1 Tax=Helicobacter pylori TaxID=210 RepID=UPI000BEA8F3E|nr:hypothetical protein [Helicobacter pylori]PDW23800.1 hypothetical protein BB475_04810 [Helicobacter pylori]PDX35641.1 hypothetical protein BB460_07980 [Helicobacter pylori]